MKKIETLWQATMRGLFILIALPAFSLAGMHIDNTFKVYHEEIVKFTALC